MNRKEAEIELKRLFGLNSFYDLQWEVIERIFKGQRVLLIEKTGFGKSLCYQFPATQLEGLTIIFSPLIALMRDQVRSMQDKGIKAATINSNQEKEEHNEIITLAKKNQLDMLYIAPERMENVEWISAAREMKIAMIVIDEAHCISIWGQSFRPNYRRIVNLVKMLPKTFPVLATTATATLRVQQDIIEQVGADLIPVRGQLIRPNLSLHLIKLQSEDEKFFWLAEHLAKLPKPGIIYTGTQYNTEIYSNWVQFLGFNSAAYSARLDPDSRKRVEAGFISNQYDCVVSTNALGMGIDKPDIRFIIHTQITQSPIHYYQEIGRAGRDNNKAFAILFYNYPEDKDMELPLSFIEGSKPSSDNYEKVIAAVKKELMGLYKIIRSVNLKQTQVRVILSDLIEQGIINEIMDGKAKKYFYNPDAPALNLRQFDLLRETQMAELKKMIAYTTIKSCRMQFLCHYLGDLQQKPCGICDNDLKKINTVKPSERLIAKLKEFRETYFPVLEVENSLSRLVNGVAASYYGNSNVGAAIRYAKYEGGGDFPDWLLRITLKAYWKQFAKLKDKDTEESLAKENSQTDSIFDLILFVPPTETPDLFLRFAEKISLILQIPLSYKLKKKTDCLPQKNFESSISKKENVKDKFYYETPLELKDKKILLIDDIYDSGCTIKEIGRYLTKQGAALIAPLVIAKTVGGDL